MIEIRLAGLLRERGKSYYWLSQQTGVSHAVFLRFSKGETRSITLRTLEAICLALECTPDDVLKVVKG